MNKILLRNQLQARRNQLPLTVRQKKARALAKQVLCMPEFIKSKRIAAYWPNQGEIDPLPLLEQAHNMGKQCYLPILHPHHYKRLWFIEYKPGDALIANRYGILEPYPSRTRISTYQINLVFVPLVAFDLQGRRLGMGAGFYDRTFAFLGNPRKSKNPKLIGLAYESQCIEAIPEDPWDIRLSGIVTEARYYKI